MGSDLGIELLDSDIPTIRQMVQFIKLGNGVLGKSSIVIGVLMFAVCAAIVRLHSDWAILTALVLGAIFCFAWFVPIVRFAYKHPAEVLLEGSQWTAHQQFLAAKGHPTIILDAGASPALGVGESKTDSKSAEA